MPDPSALTGAPELPAIVASLSAENMFRVVSAGEYTVQELSDIYNQTRIDYIVPMPMNAARLAEYIHIHDVFLDHSVVAVDPEGRPLGLGMLGLRPRDRQPEVSWITRLGVIPHKRRRGVGEAILLSLLSASDQLGVDLATLEVIKNNTPAHTLFRKWGFHETRELIILRRPPGAPTRTTTGLFRWLDKPEALELAQTRQFPLTWVNDTASLANADNVMGLTVTLPDGSHGWLVFQKHRFYLTRLTVETVEGDPLAVARELFTCLYQRYPDMDSNIENVSIINPHIPAFYDVGFVEAFRRIEMYRVRHPTLVQIAKLMRSEPSPRGILIVEDEENIALTLQESLKSLPNCEVLVARSGEEAWRMLVEQPFDLVVTDYKMADMDGLTLARRVRRLYPRTSIIMVTAYGNDALRKQAARAAVEQVLDKPVRLQEIRRTVMEVLEKGHEPGA